MGTLLLILVGATLAGAASGEEADEFGISFPLGQMRIRGDERVILGLGGCSIEGPDFSLSGDRIVLWCDPAVDAMSEFSLFGASGSEEGEESRARPRTAREWLGPVIHAAYAAGNVRYERRDEGLTIEAERLTVDFRRHRALILKVRLGTILTRDREGRSIPLIIHAEKIRQVAEREFRADRATITTCEFEEPHYRLDVDDVVARVNEQQGWTVTTGDAVLRLGSIPVFWLPYFKTDSTADLRPFRSVRLGQSSRFGFEIETLWGDDIRIGEGEDERRWGEWNLHLDERTQRGPGVGLDLDYETGSYLGRLRTYYQSDRASTDRIVDEPVPKDDRGRVWLQHRFFLSEDFRLDLETHLASDRAYRLEYLEREVREDKDPETYVQLRMRHDNIALFALGRMQANDHLTRTEYRPRISGALVAQPIAEDLFGVEGFRLLVDVDGSLSSARRTFDDDRDRETTDWVERADLRVALRSPFGVGPVRVSPVIAVRGTTFSETLDDVDAAERFAAEAGVRLDILFSRRFPSFRSETLELDGLRHLVSFDLDWLHRGTVTVDPEDLVELDEIESLAETHRLTFRMRNRLQTRRGRGGDVVDVLDLEIEAEYYPSRETVRGRGVKGLAFLEARLESAITESLTLRADADYDQSGHDWLTAAGSIRYSPGVAWAAAFEQRLIGDEQHLTSLWVDHRPTARYGFRGYVRHDVREGRLKRAGVLIRRFGHDWMLEVDLRVDRDLNDVGITLSVSPRGFGGGARVGRESLGDRDVYGENLQ